MRPDPPAETRDTRPDAPLPEPTVTLVAPPDVRSRLGTVLVLVGAGLLLQGVADALSRAGHTSPAGPLFLCGIALQFGACAWRLVGAGATRSERIWVSLVLGVGLLASYVMLQPLLLDSFDELAHVGTLAHTFDSRSLFPTNTILPVSPYYPGLEFATAAAKWVTGLPLVLCQLLVLGAVRVVLVLGVFLVVERATHSTRAGGIGVLVYAASPQFYGFDAQYAYETLGLAFAVAVVYLLFFSIDSPRPRMGKAFVLALGAVLAVVVSHHVTGWLTVAFLVVWTVGLYLTSHPLRRLRPADRAPLPGPEGSSSTSEGVEGEEQEDGEADKEPPPSLAGSGSEAQDARRSAQARIVGIAMVVGLAIGGAWTVYVSRLLAPYLGPIFSAAASDIREALGSGRGDRTLFKSAAGGVQPHWEIALILVAAVIWCIVLLPSLYSVVFKRTVRGGLLRFVPAVIAALYPLTVLANISSSSKQVAERSTTFIFFGVAVVVGAWLAGRIARNRGWLEKVATVGVATLVFLGSLLFGSGPLVSLLPGPYRVGADDLSYGAPSLALAHWADTHLPAGSNVAADKDNAVLLNAIGGVTAVTSNGGLVDPDLLYFDKGLSIYDIYLIRKAHIRYVVVDDRLAQGRPLYGTYIATGEPSRRLTLAELNKFDSYPWIKRIYDNGPIQVYDLSGILSPAARPAPAGPVAGGSGLNVGVFVLGVAVAVSWLLRLRRRREPVHDVEHLALCGIVAALVIGVFGAFLIKLTHAPPEPVAVGVLVVLLLLSLRPRGRPRWLLGGRPALDTPVAGPEFYEREEVRNLLAYLRLLVQPDDEASARRIVNVPRRGIGPLSVSSLDAWARRHDASLGAAIDHANEAGLKGKALEGAVQLSETLRALRAGAETTNPGELVRQVADRTGYLSALRDQRVDGAEQRADTVEELAIRASTFGDVSALLDAAEPTPESDGPQPVPVLDQGAGDGSPPTGTSVPPAGRARRSRPQVLLGCLGVALFALGATVATLEALKDWTPPPTLSIAKSTSDRSVANVQLGSAGPVAARLEVRHGGRTVWSHPLARTAAAQSVDVPARFLDTGSRVYLVSDGHNLRWVDGSVRIVPPPRPSSPRSSAGRL